MFNKIPKALRLFLFMVSAIIFLGIYLTGYTTAHWVLYLPAIFLILASISGICPGIVFMKKIVGEK
ncbi:MAG: hypothetical protein ACC653_05865 [Gammaproteobacteria bacterium]